MKIVRPVEAGGRWIIGKYFKCDGCDKVFCVEEHDVLFTYKRPGEPVINFIPCPVCDNAVHIGISFTVDRNGNRISMHD